MFWLVGGIYSYGVNFGLEALNQNSSQANPQKSIFLQIVLRRLVITGAQCETWISFHAQYTQHLWCQKVIKFSLLYLVDLLHHRILVHSAPLYPCFLGSVC